MELLNILASVPDSKPSAPPAQAAAGDDERRFDEVLAGAIDREDVPRTDHGDRNSNEPDPAEAGTAALASDAAPEDAATESATTTGTPHDQARPAGTTGVDLAGMIAPAAGDKPITVSIAELEVEIEAATESGIPSASIRRGLSSSAIAQQVQALSHDSEHTAIPPTQQGADEALGSVELVPADGNPLPPTSEDLPTLIGKYPLAPSQGLAKDRNAALQLESETSARPPTGIPKVGVNGDRPQADQLAVAAQPTLSAAQRPTGNGPGQAPGEDRPSLRPAARSEGEVPSLRAEQAAPDVPTLTKAPAGLKPLEPALQAGDDAPQIRNSELQINPGSLGETRSVLGEAEAVQSSPTAIPAKPLSSEMLPERTLKIVQEVRASGQNAYRAEIRLDPPELGRLDIELNVEGKRIWARLTVENAAAREQVQTEIPRIRELLESQGLGEAQVEVQLRQGNQQEGDGRETGDGHGSSVAKAEDSEHVDSRILSRSSHDGLIDLRA